MLRTISEAPDQTSSPSARIAVVSRLHSLSKSWLFRVFVAGLMLFGSVVLWADYRFGGLGIAVAYMTGERFILYPRHFFLGSGQAGDVHDLQLTVTNFGSQPVRIMGCKTECGMKVMDPLPIELSPGEARKLAIQVRLGQSYGKFEFYTNEPSRFSMLVTYFARMPDGGGCPAELPAATASTQ